MIRIDDLVRQRLSGGDEPERPGAWLNMRELLDKEMPVTEGYNWRRLAGLLVLLLLLGGATVGGYQWYRSGLGAAGGAGSDDRIAELDAPAVNGAAPAISIASAPATASAAPAGRPTENGDASSVANRSTASAESGKSFARASSPSTKAAITSNGKIKSTSSTGNHSSAPRNTPGEAVASLAMSRSATRDNNNNGEALYTPLPASHGVAQGSFAHSKAIPSADHVANGAMHPLQVIPASAIGVTLVQQPKLARIKRDSILRLEIVTRRVYDAASERYVYRVDTVPLGRFARYTLLPLETEQPEQSIASTAHDAGDRLAAKTKKTARASAPIAAKGAKSILPGAESAGAKAGADKTTQSDAPGSSASNENTEDNKLTETASAASGRFRLFDFNRLAAAIDKAKSDLARIEMYPGVIGGINASLFTPNALGGIQAGLTSLFILNDWWSLMTELKYYQRFNTGSSVRDDYMQVQNGAVRFTQVNGQDYKEYDWEDRTIRHGFNYDVVRTFELPVMLRRNWGQAYAQCGLNFVLSSAIAVRETSDSSADFAHHYELRPATHDDQPFVPNDHPLVLTSDFGARFGVGYVISAGYMFTPNIYVDGRITQSFWDNSRTEGAKQVARDLLRTPSLQISVGYRFGPK